VVVEGYPVASEANVVSRSIVLLEGTLANLGGLHRQMLLFGGCITTSDTFTGRPGPSLS